MTQPELGVLPSGHLQLFSTEDDSEIDQKTGHVEPTNMFARGIAAGRGLYDWPRFSRVLGRPAPVDIDAAVAAIARAP